MRIREGRQRGELGHLLDGFPRTQLQAQAMDEFVDTRLVINLQLREEVSHCAGNYTACEKPGGSFTRSCARWVVS